MHWQLSREMYKLRMISKEDFAAALRAHQALLWMPRKVHREMRQKQPKEEDEVEVVVVQNVEVHSLGCRDEVV